MSDLTTQVHWEDGAAELPPRRRLRLLTPVTGVLLAVLVAACGFLGGVLVEKGKAKGSGSPATPAAFAQRAGAAGGAFGGAGGGAASNATFGQVSTVHGRTLDVTDSQGNTVKVKIPSGVTVTRTAGSSVHAIHPGDTVVVEGSKGKDGTVSASTVRATAASQGGGGGALQQLFGGGGGGRAGGTP